VTSMALFLVPVSAQIVRARVESAILLEVSIHPPPPPFPPTIHSQPFHNVSKTTNHALKATPLVALRVTFVSQKSAEQLPASPTRIIIPRPHPPSPQATQANTAKHLPTNSALSVPGER
jgi:hypothetical protein